MPRRMLTGPAAEGTVRRRFLTWTSGVAVVVAGTGDGGMASMAAAYGVRDRWRKAVIALVPGCCWQPMSRRAQAAPMRLLVLGDSLSAGYGLPHADGFEAQLAAALAARGP